MCTLTDQCLICHSKQTCSSCFKLKVWLKKSELHEYSKIFQSISGLCGILSAAQRLNNVCEERMH